MVCGGGVGDITVVGVKVIGGVEVVEVVFIIINIMNKITKIITTINTNNVLLFIKYFPAYYSSIKNKNFSPPLTFLPATEWLFHFVNGGLNERETDSVPLVNITLYTVLEMLLASMTTQN